MADLQPLGSEKLQGMDKIKRILEISRFKENSPNPVNETSRNEYNLTLADGNEYKIVKEKSGYIIKKTISEGTTDYIEPMKNRKYYPSYSQALKRLNLMVKETNTLHENKEGISLFSEQKKFVLKTPNAEKKTPDLGSDIENVPPPPAEPMGATPPPAPADMGGNDMPPPPPPSGDEGMGDETAPLPDDMGGEEGMDDMGGEHEEGGVTFKSIQKLTGKLGQKLRALNSDEENKMSSKDVKYVINSILSALDIDSLDDDDKEEIISKFDEMGDEEGDEDMSNDEMGGEDMGNDEMDGQDTGNDEMGEMTEEGSPWVGLAATGAANTMSNMLSNAANMRPRGQFSEEEDEDEDGTHIHRIADEMFVENKVESILSKYFTITEGEKKFNNKINNDRKIVKKITQKEITKEITRLSENVIQEVSSRKFLNENKNAKFIGKSNKNNLVFEIGNKQYRVSTGGNII
jgi:hypothetical protein